jgi:hypothetical protein
MDLSEMLDLHKALKYFITGNASLARFTRWASEPESIAPFDFAETPVGVPR